MDRSKIPPAGTERGAVAVWLGIRDGDWDCEGGFATNPPDSSFSKEDSRECAMCRAVLRSNSPALKGGDALSHSSSSSSFIGDPGENFWES